MIDKIFKKETFQFIKELLLKNGFKKKFQETFYKELNPEIFGTVSFGVSHYGRNDLISLNPVIGILVKDVETLMGKTTNSDTLKYFIPTLSTPLGYLLPESSYQEWRIEKGMENSSVIMEMTSKTVANGEAFYSERDSLHAVLKEVEACRFILDSARLYKLPLLYYCNDEKDKGLEFLNQNIDVENPSHQDFITKFKALN